MIELFILDAPTAGVLWMLGIVWISRSREKVSEPENRMMSVSGLERIDKSRAKQSGASTPKPSFLRVHVTCDEKRQTGDRR